MVGCRLGPPPATAFDASLSVQGVRSARPAAHARRGRPRPRLCAQHRARRAGPRRARRPIFGRRLRAQISADALGDDCARSARAPCFQPRLCLAMSDFTWRRSSDMASDPPHALAGMPSLSPTMTTGNIVSWKKKEGTVCRRDTDIHTLIQAIRSRPARSLQRSRPTRPPSRLSTRTRCVAGCGLLALLTTQAYLAKILYPKGATDIPVGVVRRPPRRVACRHFTKPHSPLR